MEGTWRKLFLEVPLKVLLLWGYAFFLFFNFFFFIKFEVLQNCSYLWWSTTLVVCWQQCFCYRWSTGLFGQYNILLTGPSDWVIFFTLQHAWFSDFHVWQLSQDCQWWKLVCFKWKLVGFKWKLVGFKVFGSLNLPTPLFLKSFFVCG